MLIVELAHIGDTLHRPGAAVEPMPGFKPAKAMASPVSDDEDFADSLIFYSTGVRGRLPHGLQRFPETRGID